MEKIIKQIEKLKGETLENRVVAFNTISAAIKDMVGIDFPCLGIQLVPLADVHGNAYNPNKVAPPEMRLLNFSIEKDGLTMPCVAARDKIEGGVVIVDGFHRDQVVQSNPAVREKSKGYLPVSLLDKDIDDRITSTVRHNMARGTHQVELSAKLVAALKKHNWTNERIGQELGMDADEVLRLKQITGLAEAFADKEFSKSWE